MSDLRWKLKAKLYRSIRSSFPFNLILRGENRKLELIVRSLVTTNEKVIDLGTGIGNALQYLTHFKHVIGVDFTFSMLQVARQLYPYVNLIQADALFLPIKSNSVSLVTAIGLSEYILDIEFFFREAFRILKYGGFLVFTFSPRGIWSWLRLLLGHSIYPRTLEELITIAKRERFQIVKNSYSLMQGQVLIRKTK
jgi:ubiquinone/menaquinone biosynthesis C-methylase UbiE